jgi:hypothetical protein
LSACSMRGWQNFLQVDARSRRGGLEQRLMIRKPMAFLNQFAHEPQYRVQIVKNSACNSEILMLGKSKHWVTRTPHNKPFI